MAQCVYQRGQHRMVFNDAQVAYADEFEQRFFVKGNALVERGKNGLFSHAGLEHKSAEYIRADLPQRIGHGLAFLRVRTQIKADVQNTLQDGIRGRYGRVLADNQRTTEWWLVGFVAAVLHAPAVHAAPVEQRLQLVPIKALLFVAVFFGAVKRALAAY